MRCLIRTGLLLGGSLWAVSWAATPGFDLSPEQWDAAVRARGVDPSTIVNPLAFTPEMRAFAEEATRPAGTYERLDLLQRKLFLKHEAPFDYDPHGTLTAQEAFETRRGNCVAFTNLFIAMARSIGIPVQPALLTRRGEVERDGDLMVVNNHVVAIYRHSQGVAVFDFFRTRQQDLVELTPIDDLWNGAIYLNNLGVRALRDGDNAGAVDMLETAVRLAPRYAALYGNLGVALRRLGDPDGALDSYILGMHIEPRNSTLRNNVYALLIERAAIASPADAGGAGQTARERWAAQAAEELAQRRIGQAIRLLRKVHRADTERPEPLLSIARCELIRGRLPAARRALEQALAIRPDHAPARHFLEALNRAEPSR